MWGSHSFAVLMLGVCICIACHDWFDGVRLRQHVRTYLPGYMSYETAATDVFWTLLLRSDWVMVRL